MNQFNRFPCTLTWMRKRSNWEKNSLLTPPFLEIKRLLALVATVSIKEAVFDERDRLPSMVNSMQSIHRQFLT